LYEFSQEHFFIESSNREFPNDFVRVRLTSAQNISRRSFEFEHCGFSRIAIEFIIDFDFRNYFLIIQQYFQSFLYKSNVFTGLTRTLENVVLVIHESSF